jgi:sec-independent protein translocase protein TatA
VPFGIGIWEMLILLLVLLLVFGPKRLPEMGRSLGKSMREFKESISGENERDERPAAAAPPELPAPVVPMQPPPAPTPVPEPSEAQPEAQSGDPDRTS